MIRPCWERQVGELETDLNVYLVKAVKPGMEWSVLVKYWPDSRGLYHQAERISNLGPCNVGRTTQPRFLRISCFIILYLILYPYSFSEVLFLRIILESPMAENATTPFAPLHSLELQSEETSHAKSTSIRAQTESRKVPHCPSDKPLAMRPRRPKAIQRYSSIPVRANSSFEDFVL